MLTNRSPPPSPHSDVNDDLLPPSEAFPNFMLDTVIARLKLKAQDLGGLLHVIDELAAGIEIGATAN